MADFGSDALVVVRNNLGQYSVWPTDSPAPEGWQEVGVAGDWETCARAVAERWPDPTAPVAGAATAGGNDLLTLFADVVARFPDRAAISDGDQRLTYRDLDDRSTILAGELRRRGVRPEHRVAIWLPRGVDVFVAMLGILKAGGAYVAIDTRLSEGRRDLMTRLSGSSLVLVDPERSGSLVDVEAEVMGWRSAQAAPEQSAWEPAVTADSAACVLFTSGSSGTPKPVVLTHGNLVGFAGNPAMPELSHRDRVGHVSSLSFDAFHFETWCALAAGAEVVVLPRMSELIGMDIQREVRRRQITAMLVPTMALNQVMREDSEAFSSLRILHTGGDVVLPDACRELLASSFDGRFVNLYGPTEATTACTAYEITEVGRSGRSVPIGRPLAGVEAHVLDRTLRPAPAGEVGELHIAGVGVARGYLGDPVLTAARFRPDPFGPAGSRMYATGDLARRREDGLLEFVGRVDDQVKVRGYRVEPGEIESFLTGSAMVRQAVVTAVGDNEDRHLVAVVVPDGDFTVSALRDWAVAELPDYLVPAAFITVPEIPANDHGKRDMGAIGDLIQEYRRQQAAHVPVSTEEERYVARVWQELLCVEQVGAGDDFFDLGGHSLLAFRLQRRIRRDLGVQIELAAILDNSGLRDLAAFLAQARDGREVPA